MNDSKSVLIIEDQPELRITMEYFLGKVGYEVLAAKTGEEGVSLCKEMKPRIVLSDIMLPGMLGYDVCRTLKNDPETQYIPLVFVSSRPQEEIRSKGSDAQGDYYACKPVDPADMAADLYFLFETNFSLTEADQRNLRVIRKLNGKSKSSEASLQAPRESDNFSDPNQQNSANSILDSDPETSSHEGSSGSQEKEKGRSLREIYKLVMMLDEAIANHVEQGTDSKTLAEDLSKRVNAVLEFIEMSDRNS